MTCLARREHMLTVHPNLLGWCCFTLVAWVTRLVGHPKYAFILVSLVEFIWVRFTSRTIHFGLVAPLWFGASALHLGHTTKMPEMPFVSRADPK